MTYKKNEEIASMFDNRRNLPKYQFYKLDVPGNLIHRLENTFPENEDVSNLVRAFKDNIHIVNIDNKVKEKSTGYMLMPAHTEQEDDEYVEKHCKKLPKTERELIKIERNVVSKYFPQHKDRLLKKIMSRAKSTLKESPILDKSSQKSSHNTTARKINIAVKAVRVLQRSSSINLNRAKTGKIKSMRINRKFHKSIFEYAREAKEVTEYEEGKEECNK